MAALQLNTLNDAQYINKGHLLSRCDSFSLFLFFSILLACANLFPNADFKVRVQAVIQIYSERITLKDKTHKAAKTRKLCDLEVLQAKALDIQKCSAVQT